MKAKLLKVLSSVQGTGGSWEEVEELGIFQDSLEKTDLVRFGKQFDDHEKLATLFIFDTKNPESEPKMLPLAKSLSVLVRKLVDNGNITKRQAIVRLLSKRVIKNKKGIYLIPDFGGNSEDGVKIGELTEEELSVESLSVSHGF